MTTPLSNANLTTPVGRDGRHAAPRSGNASDSATAHASRDDSVSLSGRSAAPAESVTIQTPSAARAALDRMRELMTADPRAAMAAQGGVDPDMAAGALRTAA